MKLARSRRIGRLTAWIAIFAVLLAALAPSMARAIASPRQAMPWSDICTAAGMQQGAPDAAPASGSGQPRHPEGLGFKHCPFCLNPAGPFALPPASLDCLPAADAGARYFPSSATAPAPRFIRIAAQPRAPPAVS